MSENDNVRPIRPELAAFTERLQSAFESAPLKSGGGDGTSGGMEARVNRLEERLDKLIDETSNVRVNLATLTERVAHLPSKGFIVTVVTTGLAIIAAFVVFADNIRTAVGL